MANTVTPYPIATSKVAVGGQPVTAIFGPVAGGLLSNPLTAAGQGIAAAEPIFVDLTGPAALGVTATTVAVEPGDSFRLPNNLAANVSVNAATSGHRFSGVVIQPATQYPPTPQAGTFPPAGPTTLTQTIPSYLYKEYDDDSDLQAFVSSFNALAQVYATFAATVPLPVYTNPAIAGALLDWVALGVYGMARPSLGSGQNRNLGAYNTVAYDVLAYNRRKIVGPQNVTVTSDDVFKRIITWNFYKGDGNTFGIRWLKRRIMRFLIGTNGTAPNVDQTYAISVTTGPGIISIRINTGTRTVLSGPYNTASYNALGYNSLRTRFNPAPVQFPLAAVLQEAMQAGFLQMPFQYEVTIKI